VVLGTDHRLPDPAHHLPARQWLDWMASASLAMPGMVLAIGYLRLFKGVTVPGTDVLVVAPGC
jgi:iron(III) transport system permease protein